MWPGKPRGSLIMQLMCHCEAYTDQALAIGSGCACIIMDRMAKIRALIWCIAVLVSQFLASCVRSGTLVSELGAR
jgi:hypothetical protein